MPIINKAANCLVRLVTRRSSSAPIGSNKGPTKVLEFLERWSAGATFVILLGIIVDIFIVVHFRRPDTIDVEVWFQIAANILIAIGLAVEFICILRAIVVTRREKHESDEKIAEANARAAEANARAAKAELELAKYRSWRRLDDDAFASIVAAMKPFARTPYTLAFSIEHPEITGLMLQLSAALTEAGLELQGWPQTNAVRFQAGDNAMTPGIGRGVVVQNVTVTWELEPGVAPPLARVGQTLSGALNAVGIVAGAWGEKQVPMTRPNPTLRIMVGLKS